MLAKPNAVLLNEEEVETLQQHLGKSSLMGQSLDALIRDTDRYLAQLIDVPGHSEAGGYAHNKHVLNGKYIDQAGRLFLITVDENTYSLLLIYSASMPTNIWSWAFTSPKIPTRRGVCSTRF